ncbi:MAG TPA: prepilin-type N-terminal cleavage/methylation domain-containing protein [Planctomycetota bacterium]|nr:prepilin-type N-terminal cleavage/methylation domain-containing protein [Planctomycetota bacterium]
MRRARGFSLMELVVATGLTTVLILVLLPIGWELGRSLGVATEYASDLEHGVAAADRLAALVRASAKAVAETPSVLVLTDARGATRKVYVAKGLVLVDRGGAREVLGAAGALAVRCEGRLVSFDIELPRRMERAEPATLSSCARVGGS